MDVALSPPSEAMFLPVCVYSLSETPLGQKPRVFYRFINRILIVTTVKHVITVKSVKKKL